VKHAVIRATVLSLGLSLAGCVGGVAKNNSLESIHQPVVERVNYTLDVNTGSGGLSYPEQRRLTGWLEAMDLRYGDRIAIDDPLASGATRSVVESIVAPYGLMLSETAPVTSGYVNAGMARVVITRSKANVPNCPDWSARSDANPLNATSSNYGCASNGNLSAMVANPEHLLKGAQSRSDTVVMSSNKAIDSYRTAEPTGKQGLKAPSTGGK
jgi:pilus assembly protein CpaD